MGFKTKMVLAFEYECDECLRSTILYLEDEAKDAHEELEDEKRGLRGKGWTINERTVKTSFYRTGMGAKEVVDVICPTCNGIKEG